MTPPRQTTPPLGEGNPVAWWLSRGRASGWRSVSWGLLALPSLLWAAALWSLPANRPPRPGDWAAAYLSAVPLPTLLLLFLQGEWRFNSLTAWARGRAEFEALLATPMPFAEIVAGVAQEARKETARARACLILGALVPLYPAFLGSLPLVEGLLAVAPATFALGWAAWSQARRASGVPGAFSRQFSPRLLSLPLVAARGPWGALMVTGSAAIQYFCAVAPFAGAFLLAGGAARLAWEFIGAMALSGGLFVAWCVWLESPSAVERDDAFASALRRRLGKAEDTRGKGGAGKGPPVRSPT